MTLDKFRLPLFVLLAAALGWSFWRDDGWLQLCAGLAMSVSGGVPLPW